MKPITSRKPNEPKPEPTPTPAPNEVQGEGDYKAARRHRASVEKFIKSGKVDDAARDAEPKTPVEEDDLFKAEREGEKHSKGEDSPPAKARVRST